MPAWIWDKQLKYFSKDYNVIAMEPRSHGNSGQTSEGHEAFTMAKDIQAVVQELNLQRIILIGWSLAVPQVVNYAAKLDSGNLMGLVLVDGVVGTDPSLSFYRSIISQWSQFQSDRKNATEKFINSIFKNPQEEAYLNKLQENAMKTPTNTVMTLIYNYILQDFRPLLSQIKVPAWIATVDGPRLDYMQKMNELLPRSQIEVFLNAGHALFVDQPDQFNHSLEKFIFQLAQEE